MTNRKVIIVRDPRGSQGDQGKQVKQGRDGAIERAAESLDKYMTKAFWYFASCAALYLAYHLIRWWIS